MPKSIRRRRLERKTDYKSRFGLLKSKSPRLVIRKTNRYIIAQIVESNIAQDKVLFTVESKDLLSKGWPEELKGSLKSLPAAYLTGKLLASKAKSKVKSAILDLGMYRNAAKSRLYATLKGVIDGGISINHDKEILPEMEDLNRNEKTSKILTKLMDKI